MRACLLLWLSLAPAWAAPKLVVLEANGPDETPAARLMEWTDRVRGVVRAYAPRHLVVLTRENIEAFLPPGVDLADCEGECEISTGRQVGATYVLSVRVTRPTREWTATVTLHATIDGRFLGQGQATGTDVMANLVTAARQAIAPLTRPAPRAVATTTVHARPMDWIGAPVLRVESGMDKPLLLHARGRRIGTTPINLLLDGASEISLVAEAAGHQKQNFRVVTGGASGTITLELETSQARVRLDVPVTDVEVHLGGVALQGRTHVIEAGRYTVQVKHPCLESAPVEAIFKAGAEIELEVPHRLICGNVRIVSAAQAAEVLWDGVWHPLPFEGPIEVPIARDVVVRAPHHRSRTLTVRNPAAGTERIEVALQSGPVPVQRPERGRSRRRSVTTAQRERPNIDIDLILNSDIELTPNRDIELMVTTTRFNSSLISVRSWTHLLGSFRLGMGLLAGAFGHQDHSAGGFGFEVGGGLTLLDWLELGVMTAGAWGTRPCGPTDKREQGCSHLYGEVRAMARVIIDQVVLEGGWGQTWQAYVDDPDSGSGLYLGIGLRL